jgi:poly-gamma-glutamate synthase PgsB/CapB
MPPYFPLAVLAAITTILIALGIVEILMHRAVLRRLPIRIHVNGTRGKTSVARLISAGLRAGGLRVCTKTTGSFASVCAPDGTEYPLHRPDLPNIIEQMRVLRRLIGFKPDVVVMECMALQPEYQMLTERHMMKSTHGVITNARADHLDIMGPGPEDVARALAGSTPWNARLYTAEQNYLELFRQAAADRNSELVATSSEDVAAITEPELDTFQYTEHAENVALALKLCTDLGVERSVALRGMQTLEPEIGATRILEVHFYERSLLFVNAFAANDPESTEMIWERVVEKYGEGRSKIALVNCRFDRPQRSQQLAEVAARWTPADHYVLMGSGTLLFARAAAARGLMPADMTIVEGEDTDEVFETLLEKSRRDPLIVGMCNVKGGGTTLARFFANRASVEAQA